MLLNFDPFPNKKSVFLATNRTLATVRTAMEIEDQQFSYIILELSFVHQNNFGVDSYQNHVIFSCFVENQ